MRWSSQSKHRGREEGAASTLLFTWTKAASLSERKSVGPLTGPDARMSGDTILAIIAVSLTAIFISVFAIECDRVWQRYRASQRKEMEERAWFSRRQD